MSGDSDSKTDKEAELKKAVKRDLEAAVGPLAPLYGALLKPFVKVGAHLPGPDKGRTRSKDGESGGKS